MRNLFLLFCIVCIDLNLRSQNENFEDGSLTNPVPPSTIIVAASNAVNGWVVNSGSNSSWGPTGNCTNTTAITGAPNPCVLISPGAAGHTDAIIGPAYPIYSVFGNTTTSYPAASVANGFPCYGDWFIKINDQTPGSGVTRISKTLAVTPNNTIFNCAFMNVLEGGHCCCNNPGFNLKVKVSSGCAGPATYTSCPQFSASASSSVGCIPSGACVNMVNSNSYSVSTIDPNWIYNKWQKSTIDLSSYIGNCVTIELTAFDSPSGTRAGYTYFDAQTSPMEMNVNGVICILSVPFTNTISVCGKSTTTLTAPSAAWGYTWTIPGPTTIAGVQTITTSVLGSHTLTMGGAGLCSPIVKVINLINTPSPSLAVASLTQANCTNSINSVALSFNGGTPNSSTTPNYNVSFNPSTPTATIGVSANSGTYTGLATGVNTVIISDNAGCTAKTTITLTTCGVGVEDLEWSDKISIAPNPNNGKFGVVINTKIENAEIRIINAIGQEVFKQNIKQGRNEVDLGVIGKGIYHYSIDQNKRAINRGKIIIE